MEEAKKIIEKAIGELYRGYFMLRKAKLYQEEYNSMGTLLGMLSRDRQYLRDNKKVEA